ncbi:MAG: hypothetical protein D6753_07175 [Planctomycetota bacterium]|nr:MAG: hypothetical protein D6753_07175 [Planctomycetota bacterium]
MQWQSRSAHTMHIIPTPRIGCDDSGTPRQHSGGTTLRLALALILLATSIGPLPSVLLAQDKFGGFGLPTVPAHGLEDAAVAAEPTLEYEAWFEYDAAAGQGTLHVAAVPGPGSHTYSTQQSSGPLPTRIRVRSQNVELVGGWTADHAPMIGFDETAYPGVPLEEYHSRVVWSAPFRFTNPVDPATTTVDVRVDGLVCSSQCKPVSADLQARWAQTAPAAGDAPSAGVSSAAQPRPSAPAADSSPPAGPATRGQGFRAENTHATWFAYVQPARARPGESAMVVLECQPDPGYHIWQFVPHDDESANRTLIVATQKSGLQFGTPRTDTPLKVFPGLPDAPRYYDGPVRFEIPVRIPADTQPGEYPIELRVGFGTCTDRACDPPAGLIARGSIRVVADEGITSSPMQLTQARLRDVASAEALTNWIDFDSQPSPPMAAGEGIEQSAEAPPGIGVSPTAGLAAAEEPSGAGQPGDGKSGAPTDPAASQSLTLLHLAAALLGGFILNFMPCVLPVIGLKIMSFVTQAGNDRSRIVTLNLAFVGGIMAVMLGLAIFTVIAKLAFEKTFGWGEQFTVLEFKVALAALVFAMALSFLGVWEIPIPGFAASSKSGQLMDQEGLTGAFLKGVLTTVLATPCSGPLLGSLFGLSLTLSPMGILVLYGVVGLGMSMPYLALCIYPGAIKLLPRPGAWMETLKQVLAFPLLLTVVFFIYSIGDEYRIATLTFLIFVWFACWLVGRVPGYAPGSTRAKAWGAAIATIVLAAAGSFHFLGPSDTDLEWIPYSEPQLVKLRQEGKTVMIDFTANWCVNCKLNMAMAIDREGVAKVVNANGVVPMIADWTDGNDEIRKKLEELGSNSIPVLAIYPPDPNAEPIVLRDLLTESQVIEALERAGPSASRGWLTSRLD